MLIWPYSEMMLIIASKSFTNLVIYLLGANMPIHTVALGLQLGDVDYGGAGLHFEGCGEQLTAVFVYHSTRLG